MRRLGGICSILLLPRSWGGAHVSWRRCGVVFIALWRWANLRRAAVVWYLQHVVAAKIVGGTPRLVATLRCGIYSTSALGQPRPCCGCVVFAACCCRQDRGGDPTFRCDTAVWYLQHFGAGPIYAKRRLCGICNTLLQHFVWYLQHFVAALCAYTER